MDEYTHEFAHHIYHTPTQLERHSGIIPIRTGYNEAKPNYKIGPSSIFYYSFHFVLSGSVNFIYENHHLQLQQGDLFLLFPHRTHQYFISPEASETLRMFWIAVDGKMLPLLTHRLGVTPQTPYVKSIFDSDFHPCLFNLAETWEKQSKSDDLILLAQLISLFNQLIQMSTIKTQKYSADHWLNMSLEYIHLYYTEGITVKDIADYLGIHRVHFSNMFFKKMKVRPQLYMKKMLMEKALTMIKDTSQPITQIALTLGFSDIYSFTHSFKNYFGKAPSDFRK
ncbi:helix-turn-helix transcriptional regulator [Paenibacillus hexagrammi]|uniref:AraC family transcriptional regulator n=1 Tax=Paenibacillus hexagrammi TaxID=2908839 RepID=A0ABY3SMV5_9BACL|nr:helix-turn-helix domain-containing protein [Paenibacillus sp. YPD9-1]UJF35192.1 AraC family transcriptional regulator [Paenibacillus sp. YPD9-1]